jgi:Raf kinase inhibitor-like YbhB/YbcL family protein
VKLTSTAFTDGGAIPAQYTCDGDNVSPPLAWSGVPAGTKSFVLICDDPDAPGKTWVHWVAYCIPGEAQSLAEGLPTLKILRQHGSMEQGVNDFRLVGYGGPCPPPGKPHRYYFKLFALKTPPEVGPGATKADVERAMAGKVVDQTQLMGTYQRT